jgi:hypothetical protein
MMMMMMTMTLKTSTTTASCLHLHSVLVPAGWETCGREGGACALRPQALCALRRMADASQPHLQWRC